jgi:hypothetical protein
MSHSTATNWQLLTGLPTPPQERRVLRAGPLTMIFESGDLRYLTLGGREVIRRIYAAVRDRNWIDASFKTFCTPLRVPYPLLIQAGACVRQSITLRLQGQAPFAVESGEPKADRPVTVTVSDQACRLPSLGLGLASHGADLSSREKERIAGLRLTHLRADLKLVSRDWRGQIKTHRAASAWPLELAVHLPEDAAGNLDEVAAVLAEQEIELASVVVFRDGQKTTSARDLATAQEAFARFGVPIGAGTNADLYQLNLQRPPGDADFICWSMNPQVHAFDNASIAETPEAAAQQIASAHSYFPQRPLVVSPVTLKPRFNPVATGPEPPVLPGELPPQVDPRQRSLFGAGWTLAMLKALAEGGVAGMTFLETTGWRGVMETEAGSPLPRLFPSTPGEVFPLYHVLADAGEFAGGEVVRTHSSDPLTVQSLMLRQASRRRLMLANLQARPVRVVLSGAETPFRVRHLDSETVSRAMREPESFRHSGHATHSPARKPSLTLGPCALATLDFA